MYGRLLLNCLMSVMVAAVMTKVEKMGKIENE